MLKPIIWDKPIVWTCGECGEPITTDVLVTSKFFTTAIDNKKKPVCQKCLNLSRDSYIKTDEPNFYKKYEFKLTKKVVAESEPIKKVL